MFAPVTKWAHDASCTRTTFPRSCARRCAWRAPRSPAPCHIELPEDIAKRGRPRPAPIAPRAVPPARARRQDRRPGHGAASTSAKRPIDPRRQRRDPQARQQAAAPVLRAAPGIGVVSTFMAKGCVDMDADYCLYTIGLQREGPRRLRHRRRRPRDHRSATTWSSTTRACGTRTATSTIIHIDFLPAEIDANYHPEVEIVGDLAAHAVDAQRAAARGTAPADFDLDQQRAARREMLAEFAEHKDDDTEGLIRPQKVAVGRAPGARAPTTSCSPTSARTRCGSRATTSATSRTPA